MVSLETLFQGYNFEYSKTTLEPLKKVVEKFLQTSFEFAKLSVNHIYMNIIKSSEQNTFLQLENIVLYELQPLKEICYGAKRYI